MPPKIGDEASIGLSNLAHAVRRSTAMYVAMQVTPPDSSLEEMFETFDRIAEKISGQAAVREAQPPESSQSLGVPFDQRDDA
jgi:hypothetical protein